MHLRLAVSVKLNLVLKVSQKAPKKLRSADMLVYCRCTSPRATVKVASRFGLINTAVC